MQGEPVQNDPQELAALEAKAKTLDSVREMLQSNGFDVSHVTNDDMVGLLGQLLLGGVAPFVTQALKEVNELKSTLERKVQEFTELTAARTLIMQELDSVIAHQSEHGVSLANMNNRISTVEGRAVQLRGNESQSFMDLLRDFGNMYDAYKYNMNDVQGTRAQIQQSFIPYETQKTLRFLGMLLKHVEYIEGWATR